MEWLRALAVLLAMGLVSACASVGPGGADQFRGTSGAVAMDQVPAPVWKPGYEWAYRWESPLGSGTFVFIVSRQETVDGIECYVINSGGAEHYWRKADLAFYVDKVARHVEARHLPPTPEYVWPLSVGRRVEATYTREMPRLRQTEDRARIVKVEAVETITVPAGAFRTFKLVLRNKLTGLIYLERWYAPEVRQWIQEREYRPDGIRTRELTSFKLE